MSQYEELERLADAALAELADMNHDWPTDGDFFECQAGPEFEYLCAANPAVIKALIAENEQLGRYLCTCQDCGGEGSVHTGEWHSYSPMEPPEPVMVKCGECDGTGLLGDIQDLYRVITERDQLKAENEALRKDEFRAGLMALAAYIGPNCTDAVIAAMSKEG